MTPTPQQLKGSRGQAFLISILLFTIAGTAVAGAIARPVITDVRIARELAESKQSFALAEASADDAAYRLQNALPISASETITEGSVVSTATISETADGYEVAVIGDANDRIRKINATFIEASGVGFSYGIQSGEGGIILNNSATIEGNVFSNGPIDGNNSHIIKGDAISAGPTGLLDGVFATGTARAHTISNSSRICGDAYYQVIDANSLEYLNDPENECGTPLTAGTAYPGSADLATSTFPIDDALLEIWKAEALAGGTYAGPCPYEIDENTALGPIKIPCDLEVSGSPDPTITLGGAVWVEGNITFNNSPVIRVSSSIGNKSVPFIADKPTASTTSGKIVMQQSTVFEGNGGSRSYILMVSKNSGAVNGTLDKAIVINNSVTGKYLVFAPYGEIEINNSTSLKEVTAYRIRINNFAVVIYESGLANLLFTSGPTGGFSFSGWDEGD